MWPLDNVLLRTGFDVTVVDVNVCDLLQLRHFTADASDVNTFLQMCQSSETALDKVSERTKLPDNGRYVSALDDPLVILESFVVW